MHDVLVGDGGPAGCAAARLLALWGHAVRLVTAPVPPNAPTLAESLPPSCGKLFDVLGVRDAIDRGGFVWSTGNTVWWGNEDGRIEPFSSGQHGWQITSREFAHILLQLAQAAGVQVENGRLSAEQIERAPESVVLDSTGRTGVVARGRGWRAYEPVLKTVALVGRWQRDTPWPLPDETHTVIESYPGGWLWSVPTADGARYAAAMIDPQSSDLAAAGARHIYLAEIAKAFGFSALLAGATLEDGPRGWDASMYYATRYADDRVLLVGDAGSFIDPLSSAGVKKALASGWLAAVAAHTAIVRPGMRQTAFEFFDSRERALYEHLRALTEHFLADAALAHADAFWAERMRPADASGNQVDKTEHERVMHEFARLRAAPRLAVRKGDHARVASRPAVSGCEVVLETRLVNDAGDPGCRYSHDVDVVELFELASSFTDVGELFEAYRQRVAPVALPDFLAALSTALARGWLAWRE